MTDKGRNCMNLLDLKETFPEINILLDEALAHYSYTKTGGPADALVFPENIDQVRQILDWATQEEVPLTILGNLSNLIVRDGGIRGIVMILTQMNAIAIEDNRITAMSGAKIIDVSRAALEASLTGLEFACGIPGSTGGAVFMNAGAYGGEMVDLPLRVVTVDRKNQMHEYTTDMCDFSYRHSIFQENDDIILSVELELTPGDSKQIKDTMDHLTFLRESKQPLEYPSCGSVFKRPPGHYTGKLIQDAGLQGKRIGGAEISKKHAGFIVNIAGATATDYEDMIHFIQETIWDLNQVRLEREVRIIGYPPEKNKNS